MNHSDEQFLPYLFNDLRQQGLNIGLAELLVAQQAIDGGFGQSEEQLAQTLRLLWCKSPHEEIIFQEVWATSETALDLAKETPTSEPQRESPQSREVAPPPMIEATEPVEANSGELAPLPVRAPREYAFPRERGAPFEAYWPISRRFMGYAWNFLRRPVYDGPADVLDVAATVEQVARQGFFLSPVYRHRERNAAHLVMLIDQDGSMTPLHYFTRDLVETARHESTLQTVECYYFHNVPADTLYHDPHRTQAVSLQSILADCTHETSLLIISDGGAARGQRRLERIRATARFLAHLKRKTILLAWLNPMPRVRWANTTAQSIATMVSMFQMDPDGFSKAIEVLRGV